ncbi:MAG TPA: type II toxin-antitoxin system VapC family toxin [Candidatus Deferrimicrobium sp.]|nr:type II toxin-antitoxin system VapC family toxin [Candidatus Deferrimicrobium sp.]
MKQVLIDTDIISLFLRGNKQVKHKLDEYLSYYSTLNISILSYYEILSGLRYKDAHKQLDSFLKLCEFATIIPITEDSCIKSADIYANLRRNREIIDDVDILIAGICLENDFILVTNNWKHFSRINELEITNWTE